MRMKDNIWKDPNENAALDGEEMGWTSASAIDKKPRRSLKAWVPGIVALLIAVSLASYLAWPKAIGITEIDALSGSLTDETQLDGQVQFLEVVTIKAPGNGTLAQVASVGQTLQQGEVAFSIDDGTEKALQAEKKKLTELQAKVEVPKAVKSQPIAETSDVEDLSAAVSAEKEVASWGLEVPVIGAQDETLTQAQASRQTAFYAPEPARDVISQPVEGTPTSSAAEDKLAKAKRRAQEASVDYNEFNEAVEGAMLAVRTVSQIEPVSASPQAPRESVRSFALPIVTAAPAAAQAPAVQTLAEAQKGRESDAGKKANTLIVPSFADEAVIDEQIAKSIAECQTAIETLTKQLETTVARSTAFGTVISCLAPGSSVHQGEATMSIGQGGLIIRAEVSADVLQTLNAGMQVRVRCDESSFMGAIAKVTDGGIEVAVPVSFDEAEGTAVDIAVLKEQALHSVILPEDGIESDSQGEFVLVNLDGVLVRRDVVTGMRKDGMVVIARGLAAGERVVRNPGLYEAGDKVKVEKQ